MKTVILIPACNEESSIGTVIDACRQQGYEHIAVVDDGSTDATARVARERGALVVSHLINRGTGAATQTGLDIARRLNADIAVTIDADDQHHAADIAALIAEMQRTDAHIVIGSRFLNTYNSIPPSRRLFNYCANVITFLLSGLFLTDTQSGLKAFNRRALSLLHITTNEYEFSSEIIREAAYHRLRVVEVPVSVSYTEYSLSKGQHLATGITTVFKLIIQSLMR